MRTPSTCGVSTSRRSTHRAWWNSLLTSPLLRWSRFLEVHQHSMPRSSSVLPWQRSSSSYRLAFYRFFCTLYFVVLKSHASIYKLDLISQLKKHYSQGFRKRHSFFFKCSTDCSSYNMYVNAHIKNPTHCILRLFFWVHICSDTFTFVLFAIGRLHLHVCKFESF